MIDKTVRAATASMILLVGAPALGDDSFAFAAEVDSCVAAVNTHLALEDATRVRHLISNPERTGIGYSLRIRTSVVTGDSARNYEARCIANGSNPPLKFRIDEVDG